MGFLCEVQFGKQSIGITSPDKTVAMPITHNLHGPAGYVHHTEHDSALFSGYSEALMPTQAQERSLKGLTVSFVSPGSMAFPVPANLMSSSAVVRDDDKTRLQTCLSCCHNPPGLPSPAIHHR